MLELVFPQLDRRRGVGALADDDTTVAQFSFGCGVETHWADLVLGPNPKLRQGRRSRANHGHGGLQYGIA